MVLGRLLNFDVNLSYDRFMLTVGDLVWVPFTFSLQSRYLSMHSSTLSQSYLTLLFVCNMCFYYVFRGSNSEKNAFRTNPDSPSVRHLKYIKTDSGSKLLITGWWGVTRHINYLGMSFLRIFKAYHR